jgi:hypothetical protein
LAGFEGWELWLQMSLRKYLQTGVYLQECTIYKSVGLYLWSPHCEVCGDHKYRPTLLLRSLGFFWLFLPHAIVIRIQPNGWINKKSIATAPWIVIWSSAVNKKTFKIPTISMTLTHFCSKFSEILMARLTAVLTEKWLPSLRCYFGKSSASVGADVVPLFYISYTHPRFGASNSRITILYTLFQSDILKCIFFCLVRIIKYRNKN